MSGIGDVKNLPTEAITVELGGKVRTIKFDMNAIGELENMYGSIQAAMQAFQGGKMFDVGRILWAGLVHEEAVLDEKTGEPVKYNITPYQVRGWVDLGKLTEIGPKLGKALTTGMPDPENMTPEQKLQLIQAAKAAGVAVPPELLDEAQKLASAATAQDSEMATVVETPEERAAREAEQVKNA